MMFLSLLFRSGGRPMLTGALLTVCGITLVAVWALTGPAAAPPCSSGSGSSARSPAPPS